MSANQTRLRVKLIRYERKISDSRTIKKYTVSKITVKTRKAEAAFNRFGPICF